MRILYVTVLIFASITANSCSSSSTTPEQTIGRYDGTYAWFWTQGGIAGFTYRPATVGYNCRLVIDSAGISKVFRNDSVIATFPYPIVEDTDKSLSLLIQTATPDSVFYTRLPNVVLKGFGGYDIGFEIKSDTLFTWDKNVSDGFTSMFRKQ